MDFNETFKQAVRNVRGTKKQIWVGTASGVTDQTCTVAPYANVRLNASTETQNYATVVPKEGSCVVVGRLEDTDELSVLKTSEIERINIKIEENTLEMDAEQLSLKHGETELIVKNGTITAKNGEQTLELNGGKFTIKSQNLNLKELLSDLITELSSAVITTPAGAGAFSPDNIANLVQIQVKLNNLLA